MRRIIALIAIFISLLSLTSCFDAREIDDNTYVITIGIDRGISDKWRLTFQFNLLKGGGGGSSGGGGAGGAGGGASEQYAVVTVDAPSFYAGINMLNTSIPRNLNLSHAKFLVISEDVARSGMMGDFIAPLVRFRETRRTMNVIISKESAMEFIKALKPFIGSLLTKNQEGMIKESDDTGFYPKTNLSDLYNSIKSPYLQPLAIMGAVNEGENFKEKGEPWNEEPKLPIEYNAGEIPRAKGENKVELFGCAISDGDKMVGKLSGSETRAMMIARGDFKRGLLTIPDPKRSDLVVAVNTALEKKPEVKVDFQGDKPIIHLKINLTGEIYSIQSKINYSDPKLKPVLEEAFKQFAKAQVDKTIEKCKKLKCDTFNFGYVAVKKFKTIQEWEDYNWNDKFGNAEVDTEIDFVIRRTGTMISESPVISSEGKEE